MAKGRVLRNEEALERQEFYNTLTLSQKIERAEKRTGNSAKELARLRAQLSKEKK